jgi:CheY-like chemotaxis protein
MNVAPAHSVPDLAGKLTILVIEDEEPMRDLLQLMLTLAGHTILTAANGAEGCKMALHLEPDIILCDVEMPGLSGHEVLRALRADYQTRHIPFIFLTGSTEKESIRLGMAGGACEYLAKPFRREELEEAIVACYGRLPYSERRVGLAIATERCA